MAPSFGLISVGGKSPLTNGIKEANVGGPAGQKLGKLGINVNPDPALKRGALGSPGFTAFIPVINHGAFCGAG